ncbi:Arginase/deacetylase [Dendrothele bispora CBS 962.96]|uniref:Arginase/deacetylase n=1 Tax=Dendrothele bispora (strain CBS 962.96) TaxID=1314807 RepID=A0A4S8KTK1_DENBC|nr:Arginase/deacetylase [Dendrothele bispora CBS 962.96]
MLTYFDTFRQAMLGILELQVFLSSTQVSLLPNGRTSDSQPSHVQRSFRTCRHLPRTQVFEVRSPTDLGFSGPLSFSCPECWRYLEDASMRFDRGIVGFLFELLIWYEIEVGSSPYAQGSNVSDCGDVPPSPYDNPKALDPMEAAYDMLLFRPVPVYSGPDGEEHYREHMKQFTLDGKEHPGIVTLGGDHTIVLPILRSLNKIYSPVSVIDFDTHLDTWPPMGTTAQESINHSSFTVAAEEGLLTNQSVHAGIRLVTTDDIDDYGVKKVVEKSRQRIGDKADPGLAPATGTPEIRGWTTRKVKRILRALTGLNFV